MTDHFFLRVTQLLVLWALIVAEGLGIYLLANAANRIMDRVEYLELRLARFLDANGEQF